jgi:hypothetical protein
MSALSEAGAGTSRIAVGRKIAANGSARRRSPGDKLVLALPGASFVHSASRAGVWLDPYEVFRLMPIALVRMVGIVLYRHYA